MPSEIQTVFSTLLTLAQNMGLLLAMTFLYSLLLPLRQRLSERVQTVGIGLVFGLFAVLIMFNPVALGPGVRFDGRSVIIALACVFGGIEAGLITAGIVIPVRFAIGGAGAVTNLGSLLTIVATCYWYRRHYSREKQLESRQLIKLSLLIWAETLAWILLGTPDGLQSILTVGLSSLLFNPLTTLFVGKLLSHETGRTELEDKLRKSEQRLRQIADTSDHIFWDYDPQARRPLYVSPAFSRIWGRPLDWVFDHFSDLIDTVHPDDRDRIAAALTNPSCLGMDNELRIFRPDGEMRWLAVHLHPLASSAENAEGVVRVVGTVEDITERKSAEAQKLELQIERARGKMLREFINAASHDLRTPITVMGTSLYLLGRTIQPGQKSYLDQIETQVYRMRRLVEDMMTISQLDADESGLTLQPCSLNDFVEQAVQRHMKEATTKGRLLTSEYATPSPWARIDSAQLSHALERLIKNAIAYSESGDRITVATAQTGQEVRITVTDTGQGIDAEDLPHIFERFYRADKARGVTSGGAGLGLSIARRIVELHAGRIEVESTPDHGSRFSVILPAVAPGDGVLPLPGQRERRYS